MAPMQLNSNAASIADSRFSPGQVRAELKRVLESPAFKATPQRRRMLTYVVEEMLAGRGQEIKGYAIGIHAFDRGDNFDPNSDPLVRLEARRLRHDLDSYYVSEGRNDPLRISIPTGRYVPEITDQKDDARDVGATDAHLPIVGNPGTRTGRYYWAAVTVAAAIATAATAYWMYLHPGKGAEAVASPYPAVAVLPFEILSESERDRFLGAGIAGQIGCRPEPFSRHQDICYAERLLRRCDCHSDGLGKATGRFIRGCWRVAVRFLLDQCRCAVDRCQVRRDIVG